MKKAKKNLIQFLLSLVILLIGYYSVEVYMNRHPGAYIGPDGYYYSDSAGTKKMPQALNACDRAALFGNIYPNSICKVDTVAKIISLDIPMRIFKEKQLRERAEHIMNFAKLFIGGTDSAYYVDKCLGFPGDTLMYDMPASLVDSLNLISQIFPDDVLYGLALCNHRRNTDIDVMVNGNFDKYSVAELTSHSDKYARLYHCFLGDHGLLSFSWYSKPRPNAFTMEYYANDSRFKNIRYSL